MATKAEFAELQNKLALADIEISTLKKSIEQKESSARWATERATRAEQELEQVHAFFDALPNALPKKGEGYETRSIMTRLAAWIAMR